MRFKLLLSSAMLAALAACSLSAAPDLAGERVGEVSAAVTYVDPPDTGPVDTSAPDDDAADDDNSQIVTDVRALAALGQPWSTASLAHATAFKVLVDVDADTILRTADGAMYAELMLDAVKVRVVNARSPARLPTPADLVLDVGTRELVGLSLIASYTPLGTSAAGPLISSLTLAAADDGTGAGGGVLLGPSSFTMLGGCTGDAFAGLLNKIPANMPPIHFPKMTGGCNDNECVEIRRSWIRGHIEVFYAHLMVEYAASLDSSERSYVWGRPGLDVDGELTGPATAPSYWFGAYEGGRFSKIREVVNDLWNVFRKVKTGGIAMRHHCPVAADIGNVCFNTEALAHHWIKGRLEYCESFFTQTVGTQTLTSVHEATHHIFVNGLMVKDTHTHWHDATCLGSPVTEGIYGAAEAHHLASYLNSNGSSCNHRDLATRTVESYAQMITAFGGALLDGPMITWPAWGDPTVHPPTNCNLGTEGCQCAPVQTSGANSTPDGDWSVSKFCEDNDGEMSCATTTFNAAETVGICTRCDENQRAAGCGCSGDDDCALGLFCYGTDTGNGTGSGHCYDQDPPSWACLADCQALFSDPLAVCWNNRIGGARCLDSGCDFPTEEACQSQGLVCRDGSCVVECTTQAQCQGLGYPAAFECIANSCQRSW